MERLTLADGTRPRLHAWPVAGAARGRVLLVHGLGEHGGRYAHAAAALNAQGWAVLGHDHRGHGDSDGARGVIPADDAMCADLAAVVDHAGQAPGPRVLLGHRMGGAVAARFVAEALAPRPAAWSRPVDALVLSSPALDLGLDAAQRALLALLVRLAPGRALGNGLDPAWVSRDPAVVQAYRADPRVHDRLTPRLVRFMLEAGQAVRAAAPGWRVPTLLMWAGADRCVAPAGAAAFAAAAPAAVVQARCFDGLAHEIFDEPEQGRVLDHLAGWLATLSGPSAPGADPPAA